MCGTLRIMKRGAAQDSQKGPSRPCPCPARPPLSAVHPGNSQGLLSLPSELHNRSPITSEVPRHTVNQSCLGHVARSPYKSVFFNLPLLWDNLGLFFFF